MTGVETLKIRIFPPRSILLAIAFSPQSLHIDIANSARIDIPVIFNNISINLLLTFSLLDRFKIKLIKTESLSATIKKIIIPTTNETYILNSGRYSFKTEAIKIPYIPTPII